MGAHSPAKAWTDTLRERHVEYELIPHRRTQSAAAEARAIGVDPDHVAKTLVLATEDGFVRVVLAASDRVDLRKVKTVLGRDDVELASERVLAGAYPEFELGAVPPIGGSGKELLLVDERLAEAGSVVFEAGTHEQSVRIKTADLVSIGEAQVADLREAGEKP
jgi:Ala-tRNA(Pro) deacylase